MKEVASVPSGRRRWRRALRAGLFWIALGLGATTISYACEPGVAARSLGFDRTLTILFFALVPIPPLALGVRGLALALRLREASDLADRAAGYLTEHLPASFVVVSHYGPRDGGDDDVPLVVVGPAGLLVVQPRDGRRLRGTSVSNPVGGEVSPPDPSPSAALAASFPVGGEVSPPDPSPSAALAASLLARHNAGRVRRDLAKGGFTRAPVEACVVFMGPRVGDVASSCVPVYEDLDALVAHLEHHGSPVVTDTNTRLADALIGPARLAVV